MRLHKTVLDALEEVVRESGYEAVVREKNFPESSLVEGRFRHPALQPDLRAKLKGKHEYDIYQVWDDSETYERARIRDDEGCDHSECSLIIDRGCQPEQGQLELELCKTFHKRRIRTAQPMPR